MLASFLSVGQQVLVLFILICVGVLLTKLGLITESGSRTMTDVVLYAVTPCVIVNAFQREYRPELLGGLLLAAAAAFSVMLLSVLVAELCYRKKNIDRAVVLKFSVVFSNCGFMALPLQQAVLGDDGVFYGAAYLAVFNIFMWTYGLLTMSRKRQLKTALLSLINPGIIGTLIGTLFFLFSIRLPEVISTPVGMLAALNTPVPMLVIGYHLANTKLTSIIKDKDVYPAMALRLVVLPLLTLGAMYVLGADGVMMTAVVIAVSAPVAAFTTMMASKYGHDTRLSAGIVSLSSLLSMITMPLIVGLSVYLTT